MAEPKRRGRKRIHPVGRVRHNVNIERDTTFDTNLLNIRKHMATVSRCELKNVSQTEVVKLAVEMLARKWKVNNANR